MNAEIHRGEHGVAILTNEHGTPAGRTLFLVLDGEPYGRAERLPWGMTAAVFIRRFLRDALPPEGTWCERTEAALLLAERYVRARKAPPEPEGG